MKKIFTLCAAITAAMFFVSNSPRAIAQTNPNHVYHVNTQYMAAGLDSAQRAERNAILKEYFEKVDMKNPYILHCWTMGHFFSDDSRELITVYEYASFADIEKAFDKDDELTKQAWPDAAKRKEFMKKMNSYFTQHKYGVYHELPNMKK